jgi:hypothetical protein
LRFRLIALLAFVTAIGLVLTFPRYFLLVALLFFGALSVLAMIGAVLGRLPKQNVPREGESE